MPHKKKKRAGVDKRYNYISGYLKVQKLSKSVAPSNDSLNPFKIQFVTYIAKGS